jgi:methylmalonyl-CoA mutase
MLAGQPVLGQVMTQDSKLTILDDFPAVSTAEWESVIQADLKGADYDKKLLWKSDEEIVVRPYYREEALRDLGAQLNPVPGEFPFLRGTRADNKWVISQGIDATSLAEANLQAKDALARGADAVTFHITRTGDRVAGPLPQSAADVVTLLDGIAAPVSFKAADLAGSVLKLLQEAIAAGKVKSSVITVDYDPLNDLLLTGKSELTGDAIFDAAAEAVKASSNTPEFRSLAIRGQQIPEAGGTVVEELGAAIATGAEYLAALTARGISTDAAARAIYFDLSTGTNYFFEIAKLRALRLLWAQVVEQFHPADKNSAKAHIVATTARWDTTIYDQHINLLRSTTKTMSAALGGADVIEVLPFDAASRASDDFSRHLARNTQIVLKKESYFDRVVDPGAGSYYLESLTDQLARDGWSFFQQIEAQGGYLKAIEAGFVQSKVAASRAKKDKAIALRNRSILGTNQFPNGKERALAQLTKAESVAVKAGAAKAVLTITPLVPYRGAQGYENLRLATERHAASGKPTPRFLLLEFGDLKMRKARVGFSLNFIACGGFEIVTKSSEPTADAAAKAIAEAKADVVVLCSSDDEYLPMARPLIEKLGGKVPVIVAGSPAATDELKAAGVADFIHVRSNAVEFIANWQKRLGVTGSDVNELGGNQ